MITISKLCAFRAGRASSLKSTHSLSSLSVGTPTTTPTAKKEVGSSPVITEPRNLMHDDQFNMIPGTNIYLSKCLTYLISAEVTNAYRSKTQKPFFLQIWY